MKKFLLALSLLLISFFVKSQAKNFIDQPYIEVNGTADTLVTPDEIYIKIIISEADTKGKTSVEDLETKMVDALKSLGIETEKNLTTSDMSSNFKTYFLRSKDILKTKEYELKVGDAVTASKVFIQLEDLGISNTTIDKTDYSQLENLKDIMRSIAVANAKIHAQALVKPLNQNLGQAIYISDNPDQIQTMLQGKVSGISIRGISSITQNQELPTIDFEKIKISSSVNVKFILK